MAYVERSTLRVDVELDEFVAKEVMAPLGLNAEEFWRDYAHIVICPGFNGDSFVVLNVPQKSLVGGWSI